MSSAPDNDSLNLLLALVVVRGLAYFRCFILLAGDLASPTNIGIGDIVIAVKVHDGLYLPEATAVDYCLVPDIATVRIIQIVLLKNAQPDLLATIITLHVKEEAFRIRTLPFR